MKRFFLPMAAISGLFMAVAILPSSRPTEKEIPASTQAPESEQEPAFAGNGEAYGQAISARYFTTDNNSSRLVENGRLLAQNKKATTSKKKKAVKKKSSHLPGQFPESSERLLTEKDVEHQTPWGMKVMMNEIYARQGFVFRDPELRKHFAKEKWYRGRQRSLNKIKLTPTEVQNISFIKRYQQNAKI